MKIKPSRDSIESREKALTIFIEKQFNKLKKDFIEFIETLPLSQKSFSENVIALIINTVGKGIIQEINKQSLKTFQEQQNYMMDKTGILLSFDILNKQAEQYIRERQDILIKTNATSQRRITQLILQVVKGDLTFDELKKKINESHFLSAKRAELIASNELGKAFVEGNNRTLKTISIQNNIKYYKKWESVNDSRVTRGCNHNDNLGYVDENFDYPNIDGLGGGDTPPRFIGCRCTLSYDVED